MRFRLIEDHREIWPAALATAAVGAGAAKSFMNPGTQDRVMVEQSHWLPESTLIHGVTKVLAVVQAPCGS